MKDAIWDFQQPPPARHRKTIKHGNQMTKLFCMLAAGVMLTTVQPARGDDSQREKLLMDFGWKFHLGNEWGSAEGPINLGVSTGPARPNFNDRSWTAIDLPNDWAVALPFDRNAPGDHGYKPIGPRFPDNDVGWYRRTFTLTADDAGKRIWIEFGGVYRDSLVYVNNCLVGRQPRGYSSFRYDITDVVNYGAKNTIAVRVDASKFEGWFYEGAGIYRHVWLVKTSPLAVAPDGTFVYSRFENNVPQGAAEIVIETRLANDRTTSAEAEVDCDVVDAGGKTVASSRATATLAAASSRTSNKKPPSLRRRCGVPNPRAFTNWSRPSNRAARLWIGRKRSLASARWPSTPTRGFCSTASRMR